jgi:hypothetical protein
MKHVPLKTLPDSRDSDAQVVDYRSLIEQVLRVPLDRQQGATIDEMRKSIRVLDALDMAQDGTLALEDADWEHLAQKVRAFPWGMVDRRLVVFYDDVCSAGDGLN